MLSKTHFCTARSSAPKLMDTHCLLHFPVNGQNTPPAADWLDSGLDTTAKPYLGHLYSKKNKIKSGNIVINLAKLHNPSLNIRNLCLSSFF